MKPIQLKLDKASWLFFDSSSQRFRPINSKRNFRHGDLLYKDSEFFLVHRKKKIIPISWCQAGKKIYGHTRNFTRRSFKISNQKMVFAFEINADEEVQTSIKPKTYPFPYHRTEPVLPQTPEDPNTPKLTIVEQRAKQLMHKVVNNNTRLSMNGEFIHIKSKNGKMYKISMHSGVVYNSLERSLCVTVKHRGENLPLFDKIIAKALTIAYAPKQISTLN